MKKLGMLTIMLLMSCISFSQTVTKQESIVPLKVPVAKLVIKDILKGDGAILELAETQKELNLTNKKVTLKDSVITTLNSKVSNLDYIITQKDAQFKLEREKSDSLLKELKGQRTKTFLYKLGMYAGVIATSVLILK
jgi:TolA-binding protein